LKNRLQNLSQMPGFGSLRRDRNSGRQLGFSLPESLLCGDQFGDQGGQGDGHFLNRRAVQGWRG
jgi:hypothetical protein